MNATSIVLVVAAFWLLSAQRSGVQAQPAPQPKPGDPTGQVVADLGKLATDVYKDFLQGR
jgi:hypothetical protein